jgi:Ca2+-transporting ATPase
MDLIMRTLLVGTLMMISAFGLYIYEVDYLNQSVSYGQTVATSVFVFMEAAYLFNCRSMVRPLSEIGFFTNKWIFIGIGAMIFFQLLYIYTSVMNTLFNSSPLEMDAWWRIIGVSVSLFIIITIEKRTRFILSKKQKIK